MVYRSEYNIIVLFLFLTFTFSWFPWYTGLGAEVMAMGPSISAILTSFIFYRKKGIISVIKPFLRWKAKPYLWLISLLGPAVIYGITLICILLIGGNLPPFIMISEELSMLPLYLFFVVLMPWNGPVGEEFGWRGFLLPRLQQRFGALKASILIGIIWGVWHLPSFFNPLGVTGSLAREYGTALFLLIYCFGTISNSLLMTWLFNKSGKSGLIAGIIWHGAINFWAPVLLSDSSLAAAREGTHLPTIPMHIYGTAIIIQVVAAVILVLITKGKLAYLNDSIDDECHK